jgi:hypothetical protein
MEPALSDRENEVVGSICANLVQLYPAKFCWSAFAPQQLASFCKSLNR